MTTHECAEARVTDAIARLEGSPSLVGAPMLMPILEV
jgi:homoserine dehydrogenase